MTTELGIPAWTLGDRLAKARRAAGVSTQAMADALLKSRTTITNYETDRTRPTARVLARWAELCGVPVDWLAGTGAALDSHPPKQRHTGREGRNEPRRATTTHGVTGAQPWAVTAQRRHCARNRRAHVHAQ